MGAPIGRVHGVPPNMSLHGRSLDDLPLAAYSTGVTPDEGEPIDPDADAPPRMSAQEAVLAAQAAPAKPAAPAAQVSADSSAAAPAKTPRGLPRLKLPGLPRVGRSNAAALDAAAPFQPVAGAAHPAPASAPPATHPVATGAAFQAVSGSTPPPLVRPVTALPKAKVPAAPAPAAFQTVHVQVGPASTGTSPLDTLAGRLPRLPGLPGSIGLPGLQLRDPRVLAGGVVAIGAVLLVVSLLGGGGPNAGAGGPGASSGAAVVGPTAAPAGNATLEVTSGLPGMYALSGATGSGPASHSQIAATWTDEFGDQLGITGAASNGTRTTDATFTLTLSLMVDGAPVTFTSDGSECTVGMAVGVTSVSGTYHCLKLKSDDGKHVIDANGAYKT